jgi:hypothetical protein
LLKAAPGCFAAARKEVACRQALDHFLLELSLTTVPSKHARAPLTLDAITMAKSRFDKMLAYIFCRRLEAERHLQIDAPIRSGRGVRATREPVGLAEERRT